MTCAVVSRDLVKQPMTTENRPIVVQVTPFFRRNPEFGGPVVSVENLSATLYSAGCDVRIVSSWVPRSAAPLCRSARESAKGLELLYLGHVFRFRWSAIDVMGLTTACKWISQADLVIVHGFRGFAGSLLSMYARLNRKHCWICPHGMIRRRLRSHLIKWLFDETFGRATMSCYSTVLLHSPIEKQELLQTRLKHCRFLILPPPPPPTESMPPGTFRKENAIGDDDILVLFVGRILRIKNLHSLLIAFAHVRLSNWKLCYVGPLEDPGYARELQHLARELECSDAFVLAEARYGAAKNSAIRDADVCVLPSTYESFGHFAWEGATLGKPVVVTENCGVVSALGETAYVCDSSSVSLGIALQTALREGRRGRPGVAPAIDERENALARALQDSHILCTS
jgi:glycosyltransferase involved in cell wall biosynthesis